MAVLLGLLLLGVTAGSASATSVHQKDITSQVHWAYSTLIQYQDRINRDFINWYEDNKNSLPPLTENTVGELFQKFLQENPSEISYLNALTLAQQKLYDLNALRDDVVVKELTITPLGLYSPEQNYVKIKVTIKYFKIKLIRWTVKYGEQDTINVYYSGKYARQAYLEFSDNYAKASIVAWILGLPALPLSMPIAMAIWSAAGGIMFQGFKLSDYWESTDYQYFWIVTRSNYYYPNVVVPGITLASNFETYLYNKSGRKYYILPNTKYVSIVAPGVSLSASAAAAKISDAAHKFVESHGQSWVYVKRG